MKARFNTGVKQSPVAVWPSAQHLGNRIRRRADDRACLALRETERWRKADDVALRHGPRNDAALQQCRCDQRADFA